MRKRHGAAASAAGRLALRRSFLDHAEVAILAPADLRTLHHSILPRTDWFGGAPRDCDSIRARLHEYVDGELDLHVPTERAIVLAVVNHVANGEHCARLEAQLRAMHLAVAAVGARIRLCDRPRLPSLKAKLIIVRRVTAEAISCPARVPAVECGSALNISSSRPSWRARGQT